MRRKQRFLSVLIALCLCFGTLPVSAMAEDSVIESVAYSDGMLQYSLFVDGHARVDGLTDGVSPTTFSIPEKINVNGEEYTVSELAEQAFSAYKNNSAYWTPITNIQQITLPQTITTIPTKAFYYCQGLKTINLGHVTSIEARGFSQCKTLQEVDLRNVVSLGDQAFSVCSALKSIELPLINTMGESVFQSCKLQSVTIGDGLTTLPYRTFYNSPTLGTLTIGSGLTEIGSQVFKGAGYSGGSVGNITIGSKNPIVIATDAFDNCTLSGTVKFTNLFENQVTWGSNGLPSVLVGNVAYAVPPPPIEQGDCIERDDDPDGIYLNGELGSDENDGTAANYPVKSFSKALEKAKTQNKPIIISGQVTINEGCTIGSRNDSIVEIIRRPSYRGYLLNIQQNVAVTIQNARVSGTLAPDSFAAHPDYSEEWLSLICVNQGATLTIGSGAVLQNNYTNGCGGAIFAQGGEVVLDGGAMRGNLAHPIGGAKQQGGGAIYVKDGELKIQSGEVSGNHAGWGGGILAVDSDIIMTGGVLKNNRVSPTAASGVCKGDTLPIYGGGIVAATMDGTTKFTMSGGEISENAASYYEDEIDDIQYSSNNRPHALGAGVALFGDAEFELTGGSITKNEGPSGGVSLIGGKFSMMNGMISGNTAKGNASVSGRGGGLYLLGDAQAIISGGIITNNHAEADGGGIYMLGGAGFSLGDGNGEAELRICTPPVVFSTEGGGASEVIISDNTALYGGGVSIDSEAVADISSGRITGNRAKRGGGVDIRSRTDSQKYGTLNLSGGTLTGNAAENNLYCADAATSTGLSFSNGIYVDGTLNLSGLPIIGESDDIAIRQIPDRYVNVVDEFNHPYSIKLTSCREADSARDEMLEGGHDKIAAYTVECDEVIGTRLVYFTEGAGGAVAAKNASNCELFVPSPAMQEANKTLKIGQSQQEGNWLTYLPFNHDDGSADGGGGGGSVTTKYTLTYESNGGTEYQDERYARNTTVKLDKVPAREGYQFTGWYADEDLTQKISEIKMTSDKTVYAGWQASAVPDMLNGDDHFAYVVGYPDGSVGPKDNITRAETATIFFRLLKDEVRDENLTYTSGFEDVESGAWYSTPVCTMAELGIVKGRTETTFAPTAPITRAEFAAICARFDTGLTNGDSNFTDIDGHWAKDEIERAATLGWVQGDPDGRFRPNAYITRAEAMTMINRVLCRIPETESDLLNGMNVWPDNQPGAWYYLAVQEATNSHDFERKGEVFEKWTVLTEDPDWTRYEQ